MKVKLKNQDPLFCRVAMISFSNSEHPSLERIYYHRFSEQKLLPSSYVRTQTEGICKLINPINVSNIRLHLLSQKIGRYVCFLPLISTTSPNEDFEEYKRLKLSSSSKFLVLSDKQVKSSLRQANGKLHLDPKSFKRDIFLDHGIMLSKLELTYFMDAIQDVYDAKKIVLPRMRGKYSIGKDILGKSVSISKMDTILAFGDFDLLKYIPLQGILVTDCPKLITVDHKLYSIKDIGLNVLQLYANNNSILIEFMQLISILISKRRLQEMVQKTLDDIFTTVDSEIFVGLTMENLFVEDEFDLMSGIANKQDVEKLRQQLEHIFTIPFFNTHKIGSLFNRGLHVIDVSILDTVGQLAIALLFGVIKNHNLYEGYFITNIFDKANNPRDFKQVFNQLSLDGVFGNYMWFFKKISKNMLKRIPHDLVLIDPSKTSLDKATRRLYQLDKLAGYVDNAYILETGYQGLTLLDPTSGPIHEDRTQNITENLELYPQEEDKVDDTPIDEEAEEFEDDYIDDVVEKLSNFKIIPILSSLLEHRELTKQEIELEMVSEDEIQDTVEHMIKIEYIKLNEKTSKYILTTHGRSRIYDLQKLMRGIHLDLDKDALTMYIDLQKEFLVSSDEIDLKLKQLFYLSKLMEPTILQNSDYPKSTPISSRILGIYADFLEVMHLDDLKVNLKAITVILHYFDSSQENFDETMDILEANEMEDKDVEFETVVEDVTSSEPLSQDEKDEIIEKVMTQDDKKTESFEFKLGNDDIGRMVGTANIYDFLSKASFHQDNRSLSLKAIFLHFLIYKIDSFDPLYLEFMMRKLKLKSSVIDELQSRYILDEFELLIPPDNYPLLPSPTLMLSQEIVTGIPSILTKDYLNVQIKRQIIFAILVKLNAYNEIFLLHAIQAKLSWSELTGKDIIYVDSILSPIIAKVKTMENSKKRNVAKQKTKTKLVDTLPKPITEIHQIPKTTKPESNEESKFTISKSQIPHPKAKKKIDWYLSSEEIESLESKLNELDDVSPDKILLLLFKFLLEKEGLRSESEDMHELLILFTKVGSKTSVNMTQFTSNLSTILKSYEQIPEDREFMNKQFISKIIERLKIFSVNKEYKELLAEYVKNKK